MDSSLDIFRVTHRYLERDLDLDSVQEWLVPRLGMFLSDSRSTAANLAGLLELGFADISADESDENELRALVGEFLRENDVIEWGSAIQSTATNAVATVGTLFRDPVMPPPFTELEPLRPSPVGI